MCCEFKLVVAYSIAVSCCCKALTEFLLEIIVLTVRQTELGAVAIVKDLNLQRKKPYVFCVDVGGPKKIGWADAVGRSGTGTDLGVALDGLSDRLRAGHRVALGFEAPIWTPVRSDLSRITARRGGIETEYNRAWSAGAGTGALGAALAFMPWCLSRIARRAGSVATTVDLQRFHENGELFLWEAFVSGKMKSIENTHHGDAKIACDAFVARWPNLRSEIPAESALNHAVSSAVAVGLSINLDELKMAACVIGGAAVVAK